MKQHTGEWDLVSESVALQPIFLRNVLQLLRTHAAVLCGTLAVQCQVHQVDRLEKLAEYMGAITTDGM